MLGLVISRGPATVPPVTRLLTRLTFGHQAFSLTALIWGPKKLQVLRFREDSRGWWP